MFVVADALPILRRIDIGGHEREMMQTAKELDHVAQVWLEKHRQRRVSSAVKAGEEDFMDIMLSILYEADEFPNNDADTINKSTCLKIVPQQSFCVLRVYLLWKRRRCSEECHAVVCFLRSLVFSAHTVNKPSKFHEFYSRGPSNAKVSVDREEKCISLRETDRPHINIVGGIYHFLEL
ncbi:hypothetical protein CFOL_v3_29723 [Cephalotus follicularis]|uniref:Uncharacterized protein n=1 Tax=Cephalotus follicularis TaxID=3775 RepID=A0A1Q3D1K4_CEPFO|nr:hypothetical protein CFOL_v3_29723 [Cephalotus follicularis]